MSATYINPSLPAHIRGLYEADLRPKSIQNMLDLAADIIQEHIDNCSTERLAEVRRQAAEEALLKAAEEIDRVNADPNLIELEIRYSGYYSGVRQAAARESERLRIRAAEYREKGQ